MNEIWQHFRGGFASASPLDQVNFAIGVVGVWLMVRRSLWAFPVGMLAVAVQGVLFFRTRVYADALLQVFFFVTLAWGWWHWVKHRGSAPELPVTTLAWRARVQALGVAAALTVVAALALRQWTNALMPWRDAAIAALQVVGQVLQARKNLENWAFFTAANLLAIPAYWSAEMAYTAFLFLIYLALGLSGWRAWWKAMRA